MWFHPGVCFGVFSGGAVQRAVVSSGGYEMNDGYFMCVFGVQGVFTISIFGNQFYKMKKNVQKEE